MSRNGSGVYNLPAGNPVVTGTTIASTWANNTMNDIAAALTDSVAADGQTPMTGDLDMNTNKIINLDPATVAGNAVEYSQFVSATTNNVAITGGTINGATIGATTPASGRFTTLEATGAFTAGSTAAITGNTTVGGTLTVTGAGAFNGTGALKIPAGTTAEQPSPVTGMIRYNSTLDRFEGYLNSQWSGFGASAAGSNTQIQYNNSGVLGASSNLTYNGTVLATTRVSLSNSTGITFSDASTQGSSVSVIGLGGTAQSWQSVTRNAGTTYTNSTGRPIAFLMCFGTGSGSSETIILTINGTSMVFISGVQVSGVAFGQNMAIIPVGATYSYTQTAGVSKNIYELR